jgi:Serine dehydrogenase proteinase
VAKSGQKAEGGKRRAVRDANGNGNAVEALLKRVVEAPPATAARPAPRGKAYYAGFFPGLDVALPQELGARAQALGAALDMPVWLLLQRRPRDRPLARLNDDVRDGFFMLRSRLAESERVALVVDSPGGLGPSAYSLARLFQRRCGGWTAVVPRYAKGAATLLILGADQIYMGRDAELGPLDAQLADREHEQPASALDEVQSVEQLRVSAVDQVEQTMQPLLARTGQTVETILPIAAKLVADTMAPLLAKIDTAHYSRQARVLKVLEDYAVRLLLPRVSRDEAESCARQLANRYREHGFVIDSEEAGEYLDVLTPTDAQRAAIGELEEWLTHNRVLALGPLVIEDEQGDDTTTACAEQTRHAQRKRSPVA